jgi:signal transduction histidine kinase
MERRHPCKYSESRRIDIVFTQSDAEISIAVKDYGVGFDEKLVEARSLNIESGRGFFNMYERTEYINGHLYVKSAPGEGTTVTLRVPMHSVIYAEETE